jgi:tetratricopeptide (TPR) repeat protein
MTKAIMRGILAAAIAACGLLAQEAQVAKQPQPKSKGEVEALQAVFNAQTPDARIQAVDALLAKYADTEFKPIVLFFAAASYEQKNDFEKMVVYSERTLEADPKNYNAMLMLARGFAQRTREHDLDREEKLARAEKYAKEAESLVQAAPKPRPDITDEQWTGAKKDLAAQSHQALGLTAMARKKYDVAAAEFKLAVDTASQPDPSDMVRLAAAYNLNNKPDDAIAVLDKVLAQPDLHPTIKQFAQAEKVRATQAKSGGKPAPAAPAPPPQVEIKKP